MRSSLRRRIVVGLVGYALLLTLAVALHGSIVNERAEHLVWQTLLETELDHFVELRREDPRYRFPETRNLELFDGRLQPLPPSLRGLAPGVHDGRWIDGRERVVLVRRIDGRLLVLALDISDLEHRELQLTLAVGGSALAVIALLALLIAWGVGRLVRPLSNLARGIGSLRPDRADERLAVPADASAELVVIADAINDYLQRNERFVERERAFIDTASHELRTPIAVIAGAVELALDQPDMPGSARKQLLRVQRTARDVEQLVSLLLVLAKDPARLAGSSERLALDDLLPEIVADHRHLCRDKDLALELAPLPACTIVAPLPIVQAAIGNLLRNAIENSDRGRIDIRLLADATVVIDDPGHGMSPEEISAIYARLARGGDGHRDGGGIGLELIARLCEHLGWRLAFHSDGDGGTTTTLHFSGG